MGVAVSLSGRILSFWTKNVSSLGLQPSLIECSQTNKNSNAFSFAATAKIHLVYGHMTKIHLVIAYSLYRIFIVRLNVYLLRII